MYVGAVGAGKTYCAIAEAVKDAWDWIYTNQSINEQELAKLYGLDVENINVQKLSNEKKLEIGTKIVNEWSDFDHIVMEAKCGVLVIDEAPLWLDARKWDTMPMNARQKIIEHRKDDLFIVSTAQDVSFIDKIYRILADEVRIVRKVSLPLLGFFWPYSKRPTIWCSDCGRMRRDGIGDDSNILKRILGFGTMYIWDVFKPTIIMREQDATGTELPEEKAIGHGFRLFDIRIANVYSTSKKLSTIAKEAMAKRHQERIIGGKKIAQQSKT